MADTISGSPLVHPFRPLDSNIYSGGSKERGPRPLADYCPVAPSHLITTLSGSAELKLWYCLRVYVTVEFVQALKTVIEDGQRGSNLCIRLKFYTYLGKMLRILPQDPAGKPPLGDSRSPDRLQVSLAPCPQLGQPGTATEHVSADYRLVRVRVLLPQLWPL